MQPFLYRSERVRERLQGITPFKCVTIPGKLVNVLTKEPTGTIYHMEEWTDENGECHKTISPPLP